MWYIQLRHYAEWYYTKYFPSRKALQEKLHARCEEDATVEKVMHDLSSLIVEEAVIESRIHGYLTQGKTARYIRLKLAQKKFDRVLVEAALLNEKDTLKDPETYRREIERALQKAVQKWSSKRSLQYELDMKYPDARELIKEFLADYDDTSILAKKAPELLKKYTQEQVVAKLCQKGFAFSDIYSALRRR